ncbi:SRPBCC family protein [Noviherbaspirillum sp.]|uniref:SRPBCC family protein n=1 Tax=Noviherbaspirillum sp. TaxID=1926288 RepID=UPI002B4832E0|nr:SRPBCC family protein [Noviherbaspirillum sp.]HJV81202.1 SRPBCC family protein [Noviherbaspirillum sp.]
MTRIQQSIEVGVPLHAAYQQLTCFEDYPRFMQDVDTVRQLDDTHLHWSSKLSYQTMEWDAEITEQQPDRCIAWRNTSGPSNAGRLELQAVGAAKARVTLTMECEPNTLLAAPDGNTEAMMAHRLEQDLACFKAYVEGREAGNGVPAGAVKETERVGQGMQDTAHKDEIRQAIERNIPPSE